MVRVAHISDSHLGSSMFELIERRDDVRKCFERAIDLAMRHDPDLLVHTGDLFETPDPLQEDIAHAAEILKNIKDRVKVCVVEGNHDINHTARRGIGPVRTLEAAGLIYSTEGSSYKHHRFKIKGETADVHLISWTRVEEIVRRMSNIQPTDNVALLFSHTLPEDLDLVPSHFDYVGHGHNHSFYLDMNRDIGRPGSTCYVAWKREMNGEKRVIFVDVTVDGNTYEYEHLRDVRTIKHYGGLDITGMSAEEIEQHVRRVIDKLSQKTSDRPIVIIEVVGTIDSETERGIKRSELIDYCTQRLKALLLHIEPRWICLGPRPVKLNNPLDMRTSVEQYLVQTGREDVNEVIQMFDQVIGGE